MGNPVRHFGRYQDVIPDFSAFSEALSTDAPDHVRVNTARATIKEVAGYLEKLGCRAVAEPWFGELLRIEGRPTIRLGATLMHAMGRYYVQSASSAVSALALGALPGEKVLDLCAAPGSKTTLIADMVGAGGMVAANEPSGQRLISLVANIRRLGLANVLVTSYMGQNFPRRVKFDRVLVDAPCSGEGTWRGKNSRPRPMGEGQREKLAERQRAILANGVECLKPGGELIYSTCTYAPEENELVAALAIERYGLEVVPVGLPIPAQPGLTSWNGRELPRSLAMAARLYPHRFDSEGFFVVRMVKPV